MFILLPYELISLIFEYVRNYDDLIAVLIAFPEYPDLEKIVRDLWLLEKVQIQYWPYYRKVPLWSMLHMFQSTNLLLEHDIGICKPDCIFCRTNHSVGYWCPQGPERYCREMTVHLEFDLNLIKYRLDKRLFIYVRKIFQDPLVRKMLNLKTGDDYYNFRNGPNFESTLIKYYYPNWTH